MVEARQVMRLVSDVLGVEPLGATHMDFGHRSVTYEVALPDRLVMVRTNEQAEVFAGTARNMAILAGLGLPVPRVIASDLSKARYPFAYMILEKIPGRDLRYELPSMAPAQMTRVAAQIVGYQRRVATLLHGTGFGWVPIGERAPFASWQQLVQVGLDKHTSGGQNDELGKWERRAWGLAQSLEPYFRQVVPTCFLDDITTKNVIVQDGELQGMVDFDVVCYGDPLYMVGLTATAIISDVGPRELFYVEELCRCWGLTDQQRRVAAFYAASFALDFVRRFHTGESDEWNVRMLDAIARWVAMAE